MTDIISTILLFIIGFTIGFIFVKLVEITIDRILEKRRLKNDRSNKF